MSDSTNKGNLMVADVMNGPTEAITMVILCLDLDMVRVPGSFKTGLSTKDSLKMILNTVKVKKNIALEKSFWAFLTRDPS